MEDSDYGPMLGLITVGFLWGVTNPFLKQGSSGIEKITESNYIKKVFREIQFLIFNWKYTVPFLVNQCGSVLYFITLKHADLTMAVPVTNSLTFVFTAIAGWFLGEESPDNRTLFGMVLIAMGISCYILG